MKKDEKNKKIVSIIDIGSNIIKMKISQLNDNTVQTIDLLEYPTEIGKEVFSSGKISFQSIKKITSILDGFAEVMKEYGVTDCRVLGGTVIRQAKNKEYFIDQIKIHNNISIDILEENEKKSLIYYYISNFLAKNDTLSESNNSLVAFLGSFNLGLMLFNNNRVTVSQNIPIGSVKTNSLLDELDTQAINYNSVLEEYVQSSSIQFINDISSDNVDTLIISGTSIDFIMDVLNYNKKSLQYVSSNDIISMYESVSKLSTQDISNEYSLSFTSSNIFLSSLAIYSYLAKRTTPKKIKLFDVDVWDVITRMILVPKFHLNYLSHIEKNSLSCCEYIANKFCCDYNHSKSILSYSCIIFDKIKKSFSLSSRQRLLLQVACILHEIGFFINNECGYSATYQIIQQLNIYGLSEEEIQDVAIIASFGITKHEVSLYNNKLIAILYIADSLDFSKKQKIKTLKLKQKNEVLTFTVSNASNLYLERLEFNKASNYFYNVFGITPQLNIKSLLI